MIALGEGSHSCICRSLKFVTWFSLQVISVFFFLIFFIRLIHLLGSACVTECVLGSEDNAIELFLTCVTGVKLRFIRFSTVTFPAEPSCQHYKNLVVLYIMVILGHPSKLVWRLICPVPVKLHWNLSVIALNVLI